VKAFNAIAGIGEVIDFLLSPAAGTLWTALVLRIERNQAALLAGRSPSLRLRKILGWRPRRL
jgi:hypothetical protein